MDKMNQPGVTQPLFYYIGYMYQSIIPVSHCTSSKVEEFVSSMVGFAKVNLAVLNTSKM